MNLRADRFASPVGAGHELCVYLEAGTHDLTLVDPVADPDAQFTGWSPGPTAQWGTVFSVDPEIDAGFSFGLPVSEASGQNAYDNTVDKHTTLALSQAQHVYLSAGRACPTLRGAQLGAGRHRSLPSRRRRHFGLDFDPRCGVESGEPA